MPTCPSHMLPDLTGEFIDDGSLLLLCLLGSGAYGKVYKALDTTSPPHDLAYYAVKCMHRFEPGTRDAKIQENELMVHRMVSDHPRVITFHRQFCTDDFVFVVLELSTGGDFFSAMVDRKCYRRNPKLIKKVFGELLDAVEFCHRNSVYHRDIKPENILCNSAGTDIRLADFGLATQIAVSTQFGCGSKSYMSPESIDRAYAHGCYSARHSDLWALSVIFTNMISCRYPWHTAEVSDPGFAAFRSDKDYLLKALKITRPADALLKRCFHMNPLRRPTLSQFREAMNNIETFSVEDILPIPPALPPRRIQQLPQLPLATSPTLEWAVAAPPSAAGDCETPRPAFPIHAPQPIKFTPFVLGSSSSSSSSSFASRPPSSPPSSLPSSATSASSVVSAADSTPPITPATFPTDPADVRVSGIPSLAVHSQAPAYLPALPPRAYLAKFRPSAALPAASSKPTEYRTVASNARPTLPTRRQFLTARRLKIEVKA
ncbi:kinase-like domain-containing protein [Mycena leptocephala]|nr:kinase-like domain-containing protein [Mycena leptocephala]